MLVAVGLGWWAAKVLPSKPVVVKPKQVVLKVALITDSHNDNDLLAEALAQAKSAGVDFVIGMGDFTNTGTIKELTAVKDVLQSYGLSYKITIGDHDEWDSRDKGKDPTQNFVDVFGGKDGEVEQNGVDFIIVDNADIYRGISAVDWRLFNDLTNKCRGGAFGKLPNQPKLCFVVAHKAPYHPQSAHIMGEETPAVAVQAKQMLEILEKRQIDGFFSGDLHFFATFSSPSGSVKMTTIGAVTREPNPQGPRFGILTVYQDYSWEVADQEIK